MMRIYLGLALALATLAGCGAADPDPTPGAAQGAVVASGSVSGSGTAAVGDAHAIVVWGGDSGSDDSLYKFGDGTSGNGSFRVELTDAPPAAALTPGGWGAGFIALVDTTASVPDGPMNDDVLERHALATSRGYAIIYRGAGATGPSWLDAFPEGFSCGAGRNEADDQHHGGIDDDHDGGIDDDHDGGVDDDHDGGIDDSATGSTAALLARSPDTSLPSGSLSSSIDHQHEFDTYEPVSCGDIVLEPIVLPTATAPAAP